MNCKCTFGSSYFYRMIENASKVQQLIIGYLYVDNTIEVLSNLDYFSALKFDNLKEICLKLSHGNKTKNSYISRVLRVISKNE